MKNNYLDIFTKMFGENDYLIVTDTGETIVPEKGRRLNLKSVFLLVSLAVVLGIGFGVLFDRIPSFLGIKSFYFFICLILSGLFI